MNKYIKLSLLGAAVLVASLVDASAQFVMPDMSAFETGITDMVEAVIPILIAIVLSALGITAVLFVVRAGVRALRTTGK